MFAKSKSLGLVSLVVVLAAALGGCAESLGQPASAETNRPLIALSRFQAPQAEPESASMLTKVESPAPRTEVKRTVRNTVADVR
jgi:hypothetical protein